LDNIREKTGLSIGNAVFEFFGDVLIPVQINSLTEGKIRMSDKKQNVFKSPDVSKMQAVVIDRNTVIYIGPDEDPEVARSRFVARLGYRKP